MAYLLCTVRNGRYLANRAFFGMGREMSGLEFISTDDLIDELLNRCDHGAIVLLKVGAKPDINLLNRRWKGNSHTAVGLLFDISQAIMEDMHEHESDVGGDEL